MFIFVILIAFKTLKLFTCGIFCNINGKCLVNSATMLSGTFIISPPKSIRVRYFNIQELTPVFT